MSAIFDSSSPYGYAQPGSSTQTGHGSSQQASTPLDFYSSSNPASYYSNSDSYPSGNNSRNMLSGTMSSTPGFPPGSAAHSVMNSQMGFWSAFGTGGFPDEPSLMQELGINIGHIVDKTRTVLNPLHSYSSSHPRDSHLMDDADLAGPLLFCFIFGITLLLAGKSQFGYIYGVALLGDVSIYLLLNLMSEGGIDAYRVASVLGYCLLPLCFLSTASVFVKLNSFFGYIISPLFILWCSTSASGIFVSILRLSDQRLLVAYPVCLFYACFALLSVFDVGTS